MNKKILKRIFIGFFIIYIALFSVRAVYDLITFTDADIKVSNSLALSSEPGYSYTRNYASSKLEFPTENAADSSIDQKYEKIADIVSKTTNYDDDIENFNSIMEAHTAVIQMENRRGLAGSRRVDMIIGVRPEEFDSMQESISKVGIITSSTITKTDKTNEYRQILAEKATLDLRLESYNELKERGGSISEMLELGDKIIEVESQIQQQLLDLGEYSDENSLCTINFTLNEGRDAGIAHKLWHAVQWTTGTYAIIIGIILLVSLAALVLLALWNYLKKALADKPNEPIYNNTNADNLPQQNNTKSDKEE